MGEVFGGEFKLDTSRMDSIVELCSQLADRMCSLKQEIDDHKTMLMITWDGEGSGAFEKKYQRLVRQLGDLTDDLRDLGESVLSAEENYIDTDMQLAKGMDGIQSPA